MSGFDINAYFERKDPFYEMRQMLDRPKIEPLKKPATYFVENDTGLQNVMSSYPLTERQRLECETDALDRNKPLSPKMLEILNNILATVRDKPLFDINTLEFIRNFKNDQGKK